MEKGVEIGAIYRKNGFGVNLVFVQLFQNVIWHKSFLGLSLSLERERDVKLFSVMKHFLQAGSFLVSTRHQNMMQGSNLSFFFFVSI